MFSKFCKLLTKIITYLYCCNFRSRTHLGEMSLGKNHCNCFPFFVLINFRFSPSFYVVKSSYVSFFREDID